MKFTQKIIKNLKRNGTTTSSSNKTLIGRNVASFPHSKSIFRVLYHFWIFVTVLLLKTLEKDSDIVKPSKSKYLYFRKPSQAGNWIWNIRKYWDHRWLVFRSIIHSNCGEHESDSDLVVSIWGIMPVMWLHRWHIDKAPSKTKCAMSSKPTLKWWRYSLMRHAYVQRWSKWWTSNTSKWSMIAASTTCGTVPIYIPLVLVSFCWCAFINKDAFKLQICICSAKPSVFQTACRHVELS